METDKLHVTIPINPDYFPSKLWCLVNDPEICSICWDANGEGIIIDEDQFKLSVLFSSEKSGYFKTKDFDSIVRQLNLYGFRKVRPDRFNLEKDLSSASIMSQLHHFHNPNFKRARPELLVNLKRLTLRNKAKLASGLAVPSYFQQSMLNLTKENSGSNWVEHMRTSNHCGNGFQALQVPHGEPHSPVHQFPRDVQHASLPTSRKPPVIPHYSPSTFFPPVYQCNIPKTLDSFMLYSQPPTISSTDFDYYSGLPVNSAQCNGQKINKQTSVGTNPRECQEAGPNIQNDREKVPLSLHLSTTEALFK